MEHITAGRRPLYSNPKTVGDWSSVGKSMEICRPTVLLDLPVDALRLATSSLNAHDLIHLWLTGSKVLQIKLGDGGGVQNFDLNFETTRPIVWPSLVSSFPRLEFLRLGFDSTYDHERGSHFVLPIKGFAWSAIPSQLRRLELRLPTLQSMFQGLSGVYNHLEILIIRFSTLMATEARYMPNFGQLFPALHSLTIHAPNTLCRLPVDTLPSSLISIDVIIGDIIAKEKDVDCFVHIRKGRYRPVATWPPGLIEFTAILEGESYETTWLDALPSSLTRFDLKTRVSPFPAPELSIAMQHWPSLSFLRAKVLRVTIGFVQSIPSTLKSLDLEGSTFLHEGPNLTFSEVTLGLIKHLPPKLTYLSGLGNIVDSEQLARSLPRSLRHTSYQLPCSLIHAMPLGITKMQLNYGFTACGDRISLLDLHLFCATRVGDLPPNLTRLSVPGQPITSEELKSLPQSITKLIGFRILASQDFQHLPRNLVKLSFDLTDLVVDAEVTTALPCSLKILVIGKIAEVSMDSIKALPRGLEVLKMSFKGLANCSTLLPLNGLLNLRQLLISVSDDKLELMPLMLSLPPRLCSLTVQSNLLSDSHFASLPRGLGSLVIWSAKELGSQPIPHLPSSMTFLKIKGVSPGWWRARVSSMVESANQSL